MLAWIESEYERLEAEEGRRKPRDDILKDTSLLSEDERALLDDEELIRLKNELREERKKQREAEQREEDRQRALDRELYAPMEEQRSKNLRWECWTIEWETYVHAQEREQYVQELSASERAELEAEEMESRLKIEDEEDLQIEEMKQLEDQKRRYLLESMAWVEDWEKGYEARWKELREGKRV